MSATASLMSFGEDVRRAHILQMNCSGGLSVSLEGALVGVSWGGRVLSLILGLEEMEGFTLGGG